MTTEKMKSQSCYVLSNISTDAQTWDDAALNVDCYLQSGTHYGMLFIKMKCACCDNVTVRDFFFTMAADDTVRRGMMPYMRMNGNMQIYLPDNNIGLFVHRKHDASAFNDMYILRSVVCAVNHTNGNAKNLRLFFHEIQMQVAARAVFRRLRTYTHRTHTTTSRVTALGVLNSFGLEEIGLRIRIIRLAELW